MQTVVCMKWGDRYPALFVNRLWSMIKRNTNRPTRLICYTDDATGVDSEIIIQQMPDIHVPEPFTLTGWRKISLFRGDLKDINGDVLFFDIDMVITGSIDPLFDYNPEKFCIIHNWSQPNEKIGNTSVYRFPVGKYNYVFDDFKNDPDKYLAKYGISQKYVSESIPEKIFWPKEWIISFKHNLMPKWPLNFIITPKLPKNTLAVAFTGKPDQDEAAKGQWPVKKNWKKIYKHVKPTPWITENWK